MLTPTICSSLSALAAWAVEHIAIRSQATARCTVGDFTNSSSATSPHDTESGKPHIRWLIHIGKTGDTLLHLRQHLLVASHTLFSSLIDKMWFGKKSQHLCKTCSETSFKKVKLCEVAHKQMPRQIIESMKQTHHRRGRGDHESQTFGHQRRWKWTEWTADCPKCSCTFPYRSQRSW